MDLGLVIRVERLGFMGNRGGGIEREGKPSSVRKPSGD